MSADMCPSERGERIGSDKLCYRDLIASPQTFAFPLLQRRRAIQSSVNGANDEVGAVKTPVALSDTAATVRHYARKSRAENTLRTYACQWRLFEAWCNWHGRCSLPAEPLTVAAYVSHRAQSGAALSSVNVALSAIDFAHRAAGTRFHKADPQLALVLAGIRREHVRPERQTQPLTGQLLRSILAQVGNTPRDLRDAALLALLYTFGLRRSEAVALDWMQGGDGRSWLVLDDNAARIVLAGSKTSPGVGESVVVPVRSISRAVRAIRRWIKHAGIKAGEPLLRPLRRGGQVGHGRLHVDTVAWLVKGAVHRHFQRSGCSATEAAAKARRFAGHSGRVDLCVTATHAGVPLQQIALTARHRSLATTVGYCRQADMLICAPHARKGVGV